MSQPDASSLPSTCPKRSGCADGRDPLRQGTPPKLQILASIQRIRCQLLGASRGWSDCPGPTESRSLIRAFRRSTARRQSLRDLSPNIPSSCRQPRHRQGRALYLRGLGFGSSHLSPSTPPGAGSDRRLHRGASPAKLPPPSHRIARRQRFPIHLQVRALKMLGRWARNSARAWPSWHRAISSREPPECL